MIDSTLVRPDATETEVKLLCREAMRLNVAAVSVNPCYVALACKLLKDTQVAVGASTAFPFGADTTETKAFAIREALRAGAKEIDTVMNIGAFKSKNYRFVSEELFDLASLAHKNGCRVIKIIIETGYLTKREKITAAKIVAESGADFVKTCTGYGPSGATVADVRLLRKVVRDQVGVKAAGGIRTMDDALKMIRAGASRIGTSKAGSLLGESC